MTRWFVVWLSNALIVVGGALLLSVVGLYGYGQFEEVKAARDVAAMPLPSATVVAPPAVATPSSVDKVPWGGSTGSAASAGLTSKIAPVRVPVTPAPMSIPTPTPIPGYPAHRIVAPAIDLDAKVVEAPIQGGNWAVPKFAAGHLEGTDQPLQGGNVVLVGHVESISSGDVFADVGDLRPGNKITLYTDAGTVIYRVRKVEVVKNDDMRVVAPSAQEQLTLITCTGTWLPLQRDFSERTVVIATPIE